MLPTVSLLRLFQTNCKKTRILLRSYAVRGGAGPRAQQTAHAHKKGGGEITSKEVYCIYYWGMSEPGLTPAASASGYHTPDNQTSKTLCALLATVNKCRFLDPQLGPRPRTPWAVSTRPTPSTRRGPVPGSTRT